MVYVDNLVQGVALAERHPAAPGQAFWVADRDAYPLRDVVATVRQALDEEGFRTRDTVVRIPRVLAAMAETADRAPAAPGPLLDAGPRPRRAGPHHPLRHLAVGRGARLRPPGRPAGRHATFGALVRARGLRPRPAARGRRATRSRRRERQDGSGHRGQRLLRVAAGRAPACRRLPGAGARPGRRRRPPRRRGVRPGRHPGLHGGGRCRRRRRRGVPQRRPGAAGPGPQPVRVGQRRRHRGAAGGLRTCRGRQGRAHLVVCGLRRAP